MKATSSERSAILKWVGFGLAAALAIGWYVDHDRLEERVYRANAERDAAKQNANKVVADVAPLQQELKLTKQALIDADDTRSLIGKRLQDCEAREMALHAKAEKR
jgi:hypothetical protein